MKNQALHRKLRSIFVLRALILVVIAFFAVLFSSLTIEYILIKDALRSEAEYFWDKYERNPETNEPDTWNLKSYLVPANDLSSLPESYQGVSLGFTRLNNTPGINLLYKTERNGKRLLLIFNADNIRGLAIYLGVIPLTLFLLFSYLIGWLFYRKTAKVLSPIAWLAKKFESFDPVSAQVPSINFADIPGEVDYETSILAESLSDYVQRIEQFVDRERAFTRDVSHELRTPLTVVNMAVNLLESSKDISKADLKSLSRIKSASKDMLELVDVFLILARESIQEFDNASVCINEVVEHQLLQLKPMLDAKKNSLTVNIHSAQAYELETSSKILEVMLGNLIQNAIKYTEKGQIDISITQDSVTVEDTGIGMSQEQVDQIFRPFFQAGTRPSGGYGVGLTIVKRIADRFDWLLSVNSKPNHGTKITIKFKRSLA